MRILIISNQKYSKENGGNPVINNIVNSLKHITCVDYVEFHKFKFTIESIKSIYWTSLNCDCVHVHFGGLYALIVGLILKLRNKPTFITFHGTDIHGVISRGSGNYLLKIKAKINKMSSMLSTFLYSRCGFVSKGLSNKCPLNKSKHFIDKLGVDYDVFRLANKSQAKKYLELSSTV